MQNLKDILKSFHQCIAKPNGFRKKGNYFYRRVGLAVQTVHFQKSRLSETFYVNVGVAFDEICNHFQLEIKECPKIEEFEPRGFYFRLERLVDCSEAWDVELSEGKKQSIYRSVSSVIDLLTPLVSINKLMGFEHPISPSLNSLRAIGYYIHGDYDKARLEVEDLCNSPSVNPRWSEFEPWLKRLNLPNLK